MKLAQPSAKHHAFRNDCIELLRKHAGELPAIEILALSAHLVGQIIAMQDQRTINSAMVMKLVAQNIEQGNAEVLQGLLKTEGQA